MHRIVIMLLVCGAGVIFPLIAQAAQEEITISDVPDHGKVIVSGVVEKVKNTREFILHDRTGDISIKLESGKSLVLKQGDSVTVYGVVETPLWSLMGKEIAATSVDIHKDLSATLSDAVKQTTGISVDKATAVQIEELPDHGMVQVTGRVSNITDKKSFTIMDSTGTVDVSVESDENIALVKGAKVNVTGYAYNGIFGRQLRATHVVIVADAPANTKPMNPDVK